MLTMFLPPYSDEHIVSWFLRMAHQHGLNVKMFNAFCSNMPVRTMHYFYDSLGTDYYGGFFNEIDRYYQNGNIGFTGLDIFKKTSLYTSVRSLLSEPLQNSFIQGVFDPHVDRKFVNHVGTMMVCPLCAAEDIEQYHNPIYHRSHHAPGVTACWRHGTKLIPVPKREIRTFVCQTTVPPYYTESATVKEVEYAVFAKHFMECEWDCSKEDMVYVIRSLYAKTRLSGLTIKEEKGLQWIRGNFNGSPGMLLKILFLYTQAGEDVDAVIRANVGVDVLRKNAIQADPRYSIISDFSNTLVQIKDIETTQRIITTPSLILNKIQGKKS